MTALTNNKSRGPFKSKVDTNMPEFASMNHMVIYFGSCSSLLYWEVPLVDSFKRIVIAFHEECIINAGIFHFILQLSD